MKSPAASKLKQVLASNAEDIELMRQAGVLSETDAAQLKSEVGLNSLAAKYYDLAKFKKDILGDLGGYDLKEIEFEPGKYEVPVDFLGSLETAISTMGLQEVGIEETESGFRLGTQEASSISELGESAEQALNAYADRVAQDLDVNLGLPGKFFYGFDAEYGNNGFRLFYVFEESDLALLSDMGANVPKPQVPLESPPMEASFDSIIAALDAEGCHDLARQLHQILREN